MSASDFSRRLTLLACALSWTLSSQDAPAPFKSNTNLVIVNITARDKSGKLIDNLTKQDFVVLEDGKPQVISVFELQKLSSEVLPRAAAPEKALIPRDNTKPAVQTPAAKPEPPSPERLDPGAAAEVSYRNDKAGQPDLRRGQNRRLIALFFDLS